jgi:hypothetical protein
LPGTCAAGASQQGLLWFIITSFSVCFSTLKTPKLGDLTCVHISPFRRCCVAVISSCSDAQ